MSLLLLTLAALLTALCRTFYKLAMKSADEVAIVTASQIVAASVSLPLLIWFFPTEPFDWQLLLLESALWGAFVYFEIRSLRHLDLGIAAILGSAEYVLQVGLGMLLFHESPEGWKAVGFVLILAGLVAAADWRIPSVRTGVIYQLLAVLCAVAVLPIDAVLVRELSPWFVGAFAYLGPATILFLWRRSERAEAFRLIRTSAYTSLSGVTNVAGYCLLLLVLTRWNFTDTVASFQLMACFSLLLGWFVLKEREHLVRKIVSFLLIVGGVGFLRV